MGSDNYFDDKLLIDIKELNKYIDDILESDSESQVHSNLLDTDIVNVICNNENVFKLQSRITYHKSDYTDITKYTDKSILHSNIYNIDMSDLLNNKAKANLYYLDFIIDFYKSVSKYLDKYNILDDNIYLKDGEKTNEHVFEFNSKYYLDNPQDDSIEEEDDESADSGGGDTIVSGGGPPTQKTFSLELIKSEKSVNIKYKIEKKIIDDNTTYEIVIVNDNINDNFNKHKNLLILFSNSDTTDFFEENSKINKLFDINKNIMCNGSDSECVFKIDKINKFTYLYFVIYKLQLLYIIIEQLINYDNGNNKISEQEIDDLLINFDYLLKNNKKDIKPHIDILLNIIQNKNNQNYDSELYNNAIMKMNTLNDINLNLNNKKESIEHINNSINNEKNILTTVYIFLIITVILFIITMISLFLLKNLSIKYILILITIIVIYTFISLYILNKTVNTTKAIEHFIATDTISSIKNTLINDNDSLNSYKDIIKDIDKDLTMSLGELVTPLLKKEVKKFEDYNDKTNIYNRIQQFKINIEHYDVKYNIVTIKYILSIIVLLGLMIFLGYYLYDFIKVIIIISIIVFVLLSCIYIIQILKIIRTKSKNTYYTNSRKIG